MKKEMLMIIVFLLGASTYSFAGTGNATGALYFFLIFIGLLLIILGLIVGVDYLQKNGKTMIYNATSFLKKKIALLREYLNKLISDYFDVSYY